LVTILEAREGHIGDRVLLVVSLVGRDERSVGGQREMNTREGHQVGLELVKIDVETTIETEGSGDTGDNLRDQTVDIDETRCGNAETLLANVSDRLIIDHERAVRVLESGVGRQDGIVGLNDG